MASQQIHQSSSTSRSRTTILDLPQEIRNEVLSYLLIPDRSQFSRSCRALYASHGSSLYTNITITAPLRYAEEEGCTLSSPSPHGRLLTRTISQDLNKGRLISSLHLRRFNAWYDSADVILNKTPNLSSLHLDYLLAQHFSFGADLLNATAIPHMIQAVRDTLVRLQITYQVSIETSVAPRIAGFCDLKSFTQLKTLEVPWCILFGNYKKKNLPCGAAKQPKLSDVLPSCLTRLKFVDDGSLFSKTRFTFAFGAPHLVAQELKIMWPASTIYSMISEFVSNEAWRAHTPSLQEISADMFDMRDDESWGALTGQSYELMGEKERLLEELIRGHGLRCERFRLHPSLDLGGGMLRN